MHRPYVESFERNPDFRVQYEFLSSEQGGRKTLPFQGIRLDLKYNDEIFIVWPEFERNNTVILDDSTSVDKIGTATLWIVNEKMRSHHLKHLKIGTKCHFVEGNRIVANCEIVETFLQNN